MRRQRIELSEIGDWDNLVLATWKAARGKRLRPDVATFLDDLDGNLSRLAEDIVRERAPRGTYREFSIRDPKPRQIHAACFEDRVLHHAILNVTEAVFERALVDSTFACRPGKGVHRAVAMVQSWSRRCPWYVQVDVDGYFPSIPHDLLLQRLGRKFKGHGFLRLLARIVDSYHASPGLGLPIGSLTSQHFANLYLDGADRFLLGHPDVQGHVRYMDDIAWWCRDQTAARRTLREFGEYIGDVCRLRLKPAVRINRSAQGMSYCGYRVTPDRILLGPRKRRRFRTLRQRWELTWETGLIDDRQLQSAFDSVLAITAHSDSRRWRQRELQLRPSRYIEDPGWGSKAPTACCAAAPGSTTAGTRVPPTATTTIPATATTTSVSALP